MRMLSVLLVLFASVLESIELIGNSSEYILIQSVALLP